MHPVTVHKTRLHKASLRSPAAHSDRTPGPRNSQPNAEPFTTPHIPGSYRLRRHFPRYCDVTTRVGHPYQPRILPANIRSERGSLPRKYRMPHHRLSHPPDDGTSSCKERDTVHPAPRPALILPACLRNAGNQTLRGHLAELDTADAEQADVTLGTTGDLAAVVLADGIRVAGLSISGKMICSVMPRV